jgi:hypothetical protein
VREGRRDRWREVGRERKRKTHRELIFNISLYTLKK